MFFEVTNVAQIDGENYTPWPIRFSFNMIQIFYSRGWKMPTNEQKLFVLKYPVNNRRPCPLQNFTSLCVSFTIVGYNPFQPKTPTNVLIQDLR